MKVRQTSLRWWGIALIVWAFFFTKGSEAQAANTIPVSQIRRGMVGYGLTVLHGFKPTRFRVRVIGILHNAFPKQDLIVIMCDDPKLAHFGVAAGMSGSPIFFKGRLAGALAYGPVFSKDPIAMVTPIANMLAELKRPLHGMSGQGGGPGPMAKSWFSGTGFAGKAGRRHLLDRAQGMARRSLSGRSPILGVWAGPSS